MLLDRRMSDALYQLAVEQTSSGIATAERIWMQFHAQNPKVDFDSFRKQLMQLTSSGRIRIIEPRINTLEKYAKSWIFGFRLWSLLISAVVAITIVWALPPVFPMYIFRWIAGTYLVLFLPGYGLTWTLLPSRKKPSGANRFAISVAMSLFLTPAIGMILNYTPMGIRPEPVAIILSILAAVFLVVGAYREFRFLQRTSKLS